MGKTFKDRGKRFKEKDCLHCLGSLSRRIEKEKQEYILNKKVGKPPRFKFK